MAGHRSLEPAVVVRIHPGQSTCGRHTRERHNAPPQVGAVVRVASRASALALALLLGVPVAAPAQVSDAPPDTSAPVPDPGDALSAARAAQARFERRRTRYLPLEYTPSGGNCDEHVGRFCTWYGEGEWFPVPEDEHIVAMRTELLTELDALQAEAPASGWILGQRVWYRSEAGDWAAALEAARRCGDAEGWWCAALEGFALHGSGRYRASEAAFARSLALMDEERRVRWSVLRWPIDDDARELLEDAAEGEARSDADPTLSALLDRLWTLADPLFLLPGNDRRTAHFARWTVVELREDARNPFHISWGDDLAELNVRHGWELGWERSPTRSFTSLDYVIGHKHPEGRDYMPPGSALLDPGGTSEEDLRADRRRPRSLYAPAYAPVLLPMDGQLAVFPRVGGAVVVATHHLPADTTFHADHDHPLPWLEPGDQAGQPDRIGLFLLPVDDRTGRPFGVHRVGSAEGALLLRADEGAYVVSAESWSPSLRRAGRTRRGLRVHGAVEDVATLSDLVLLRPGVDPSSLEEALPNALPRTTLTRHERFTVAWEVAGLGFRPETLEFEISVDRADRSVFRKVGEFLRLADAPRPLGLAWREPAANRPGPTFHAIELDLPPLDAGRYRVRLVLRTAGRSSAERVLEVTVADGPPTR